MPGHHRSRSAATAFGSGRIDQITAAAARQIGIAATPPRVGAEPHQRSERRRAARASSGPEMAPNTPAEATRPTPRARSADGYRSAAAARPISAGWAPSPNTIAPAISSP